MTPAERAELCADLAGFEFDPVGFVYWAFPWGDPEKSLATDPGPEQWQLDHLRNIGEQLLAGGDLGAGWRRARPGMEDFEIARLVFMRQQRLAQGKEDKRRGHGARDAR